MMDSFPRHAAESGIPGPRAAFAIEPSRSPDLGPQVLAGGTRFAVYSRHARSIQLALFREEGGEPVEVLPLPSRHGHVFQGFVPKLEAGWMYGFLADGPYNPRHGHRFNPRKLLIDPYARALHGVFHNPDGVLHGHAAQGGEDADLIPDHRPSHAFMPKCVLTESRFDWQGDRPLNLPREDMVIYEAHARGFTAHASSGVAEPGTFRGFAEKISHLKSLGVNAVELLPVHAKFSEGFLADKGLSNYWGYNTAAFFALEPSYGSRAAPGCEIDEFKFLVRELHRAGIEVILDVVYNHSAEGNESGPTLSLRGLDNRSYYALHGSDDAPLRRYRNHTGCGNALDFGSPAVLRLTLDSLRYFAEEFHVDGFRFDLATVHGRRGGEAYDPAAPFFAAVAQDPVLRRTKLIAEPWDLEAYGVGRFPEGWMEWNGGFRDAARRWVAGQPGVLPLLREKLEGSPEDYAASGREPWAGVNFVTCHDGFTLRDLVTYQQKRNHANGEDNCDGSDHNHSWNCGVEGESGDPGVEALRQRQARNLLLLTLMGRGTPMLLAGDEMLRTQAGNNNGYSQDNPVSWMDWERLESQSGFARFFREAVAWRKAMRFPNARLSPKDAAWCACWSERDGAGRPAEKNSHHRHAAFLYPSGAEPETGERPDPEKTGSLFYLLLNAEDEAKTFRLPSLPPPWGWVLILDTSKPSPEDIAPVGTAFASKIEDRYETTFRSSVLLQAAKLR